jgi:hypothetical protein
LKALAQRNCANRGEALALTVLATLGFVLELFIVKKQLLARGKDEIRPAVNAL